MRHRLRGRGRRVRVLGRSSVGSPDVPCHALHRFRVTLEEPGEALEEGSLLRQEGLDGCPVALRRDGRCGGQGGAGAGFGVDPGRLIARTLDDLVGLPSDVVQVGRAHDRARPLLSAETRVLFRQARDDLGQPVQELVDIPHPVAPEPRDPELLLLDVEWRDRGARCRADLICGSLRHVILSIPISRTRNATRR